MANLINVLKQSFQLLIKKPVLFAPKLISVLIGSIWFIGLFSRTGPLILYVLTAPLTAFIGLFVSVMLAAMVRNSDESRILKNGFNEAKSKWKKIMAAYFLFLSVGLVSYLPLAGGFIIYYLYGTYIALIFGGLLSILILLTFGFLAYFFPISFLETGSVIQGFNESALESIKNSRHTAPLTLFSFSLLVAASFSTEKSLRLFGYFAFLLFRMASAVVTTYIFVVSPKYYLSS